MRKVGPPPGRHERQLGAALFILLAAFLPTMLWAQGARPEDDIVLRNQNGLAAVVPGANIYTCAGGATVNFNTTPPCTTITVFTDPALTMPITQPLLSDANGNFTEYAVSCATYTLAFTYPNTPGFSKQWTSPCVNFSGPQFGTATITTGIITNLTATNETVTSLTITGTCTGCPGSPPGGAASTLQYNNAGAFGGVAGSIVSSGGITLQPGASVTPLTVLGTTGQTVNVLDVNNQSGGARPGAAVSFRGKGLGSFGPGAVTSVVNIQQESIATATNGLVLTNRQAIGSGSVLSSLDLFVNDSGISGFCGGNAVGDANDSYGCIAFDEGPGTTGTTVLYNSGGATTVVPFAIQNNTVGSTADLFDISNSSGLVDKFTSSGTLSVLGTNTVNVGGTSMVLDNSNFGDTLTAHETTAQLHNLTNSTGTLETATGVGISVVTVNGNVTTDQNLMAGQISANQLAASTRTLRLAAAGVYSTAAASTAQLTFKVKLCSVSGCGSGTVITPVSIQTAALGAVTANNNSWRLNAILTTSVAGAASTYEAYGDLDIGITAANTDAVARYQSANTSTVGTIDNTSLMYLQITAAASAASASNVFSERHLLVENVSE